MVRLAKHARTRAYVQRRTKQGLGKKEIIRCLKRYIAREIFRVLTPPAELPLPATLASVAMVLTNHRSVNAVAESFFATLKTELIYRDVWPTRRHAQLAGPSHGRDDGSGRRGDG
jgi:hypothetical protein